MQAMKRETACVILALFLLICIFSKTLAGSATSNKEQLIDNYGGQIANTWLCGYLGTSQPSHNASTSAHGSDFYVASSSYITTVRLVVARDSYLYSHYALTNGWTDTPTVNVTLDIYALSNQSYAGLPVKAPLTVSIPLNSSTFTPVSIQTLNNTNIPLQNVATYYQNFTFSSPYLLHSNTYYGMALQAGNVGIINESRRVWLYFFNTTISGRTVFWYQNNAWGNDYPAVDCMVMMQIYGYGYSMIATITPSVPLISLIVIIGVVIVAVATYIMKKRGALYKTTTHRTSARYSKKKKKIKLYPFSLSPLVVSFRT